MCIRLPSWKYYSGYMVGGGRTTSVLHVLLFKLKMFKLKHERLRQ